MLIVMVWWSYDRLVPVSICCIVICYSLECCSILFNAGCLCYLFICFYLVYCFIFVRAGLLMGCGLLWIIGIVNVLSDRYISTAVYCWLSVLFDSVMVVLIIYMCWLLFCLISIISAMGWLLLLVCFIFIRVVICYWD